MEKRLFIGIKILPSENLIELYKQFKLRLEYENIRWIPFENMHITLHFLGNTHMDFIPQVKLAIEETAIIFNPFNFRIRSFGYFKKNKKVHVVWMGIDKEEVLSSFAHSLMKNMQAIGFVIENRNFNAHLTIGRVKSILDEDQFLKIVSDYHDILIQNVNVMEIALFESIQRPEGSFYKVIEYFPLIQG